MERKKKNILGFTTYFCRVYRCYLTKKGCEGLQKRSKIARKLFLSSNPPQNKYEVNFVLDPLICSDLCPCRNPISQLSE